MNLIRVINATCDDILQEVLENELPNVSPVNVRFFQQLEEVLQNDSNFQVILFKEDFVTNYHPAKAIKLLRETYPHIRIVFILTSTYLEDVNTLKTYLYSKQIYDIIYDSEFGIDNLISALMHPRTYEDVLRETSEVDFEQEFDNFNKINNIMNVPSQENNVSPTDNINFNYNNNIQYQIPSPKVISFWSPKGGTGVDTLAINTALMLAKNTNIDVCIADFSEIPNLHLYFNLAETFKNVEKLYEHQISGKLNSYTIPNCVINGAETFLRLPNLHIIPGATRIMNFYRRILEDSSASAVGRAFEDIISTLNERYTIVILILSSNIYHVPTYASLRKCNQINVVLENDVSSFYNANRYLDLNAGLFNIFKVNRSKCKFIVNKFYVKDDFHMNNFSQLTGIRMDAFVDLLPEEFFHAIKNSDPLTILEKNDLVKYNMLNVVNTITPMQINSDNPNVNKEKKPGIFNAMFSKKSKNK